MKPLSAFEDLRGLDGELERLIGVAREGRVTEIVGTVVRATLPEAHLGELVHIERVDGAPLEAEVIGFDRRDALLMPLGGMASVRSGARVTPAGERASIPCGDALLGRVIDALGRPLDGGPELSRAERTPLEASPPNPLARGPIRTPLATGVRAIDGLLTVGRGQRVGIFAAAGVGKSTLLSAIARNVEADRVVLALIGERGREVRGFLEEDLGPQGLAKSTVVVSTSDQPALLRLRAALAATAIAEAARARGEHVVLLMDSVTRFARALREVGLAAGEPPGRQGYPASVFAALPRLFERAGNDADGSITAFYTVLVAGDDLEEPIADESLSLLDGHIVLSRKIATTRYPAVDVLRSKSRLMRALVGEEHLQAAQCFGRVLALYEQNYDKLSMGLYEPATAEEAATIERHPAALEFLRQGDKERTPLDESSRRLIAEFGARRG